MLIKRPKLVLLAVVMATLGVTPPLSAAPLYDAGTSEVRTTVTSVPLTATFLNQVESGNPAPEAALRPQGMQPGQEEPPTQPPLTPEQIKKAKQPGGYTYTVDSSEYATPQKSPMAAIANVDRVTPKECTEVYTSGYNDDVWFKNRFASCRGQGIIFTKNVCDNSGCKVVARMSGALTITYNMAPESRAMYIGFKFIALAPGANYPTTETIDVRAACFAVSFASDAECKGYTTPAPNENIITATNTVAEWRRIEGEIVNRVDLIGYDKPDNPESPIAQEKRTFFLINPVVAEMQAPGVPGDNTLYMPTNYFRCDEARENSQGNYVRTSDCVFHKASGIFQLSLSDPLVAESSAFIADAQDNITQTAPGTPGSYVPGQFDETEPLTRLYYDGKLRKANHRRSVKQCISTYGKNYRERSDGLKNDCDEYPFQSTYQGSSTVSESTFPRSFAVRPVLDAHNQKAGSRLATWYAADHILDGDPFFVEIVP